MTTGKTIALTTWTFVSKVMSVLFNALSRFVIAFLPRSKPFNFMAAVTIHSDFGAQENKVCHCFHCFPIYMPWSDGTRCHDLSFWMLSLKPAFSLSSFTFIKRLLSSSSLSAIRVVSSAYLKLLIFLPAILIPICSSFSLAFCMIYSAYKLNKQGENIQPWHTPCPVLNKSVVPCSVPTVASRPAYRFHRRQVWWSGKKELLREPKMIFIRKYFINHKSDFCFSLSCIGEGNGNPLQCCCLENPRDGGAWWAAIYGVAQSRTRLKWLSGSSSGPRCMVCEHQWALKPL